MGGPDTVADRRDQGGSCLEDRWHETDAITHPDPAEQHGGLRTSGGHTISATIPPTATATP